jgi:hypothetical protein
MGSKQVHSQLHADVTMGQVHDDLQLDCPAVLLTSIHCTTAVQTVNKAIRVASVNSAAFLAKVLSTNMWTLSIIITIMISCSNIMPLYDPGSWHKQAAPPQHIQNLEQQPSLQTTHLPILGCYSQRKCCTSG